MGALTPGLSLRAASRKASASLGRPIEAATPPALIRCAALAGSRSWARSSAASAAPGTPATAASPAACCAASAESYWGLALNAVIASAPAVAVRYALELAIAWPRDRLWVGIVPPHARPLSTWGTSASVDGARLGLVSL